MGFPLGAGLGGLHSTLQISSWQKPMMELTFKPSNSSAPFVSLLRRHHTDNDHKELLSFVLQAHPVACTDRVFQGSRNATGWWHRALHRRSEPFALFELWILHHAPPVRFYLPQSSSASRLTAAQAGFFDLSQSAERPLRYGESLSLRSSCAAVRTERPAPSLACGPRPCAPGLTHARTQPVHQARSASADRGRSWYRPKHP